MTKFYTEEQIDLLWMHADYEFASYTNMVKQQLITEKEAKEFESAWRWDEDRAEFDRSNRIDGRNFIALFLLAEAGEL